MASGIITRFGEASFRSKTEIACSRLTWLSYNSELRDSSTLMLLINSLRIIRSYPFWSSELPTSPTFDFFKTASSTCWFSETVFLTVGFWAVTIPKQSEIVFVCYDSPRQGFEPERLKFFLKDSKEEMTLEYFPSPRGYLLLCWTSTSSSPRQNFTPISEILDCLLLSGDSFLKF